MIRINLAHMDRYDKETLRYSLGYKEEQFDGTGSDIGGG